MCIQIIYSFIIHVPEKLWIPEGMWTQRQHKTSIIVHLKAQTNKHTIAGSMEQNRLESKEMKNEPKGADNTKSHQSEREGNHWKQQSRRVPQKDYKYYRYKEKHPVKATACILVLLYILGIPETNFSGRKTLTALSVLRSKFPVEDEAKRVINLEK